MNDKTEFYQHALISRLAYKDLTPDVLKEWEGLGFTYVKFFSIEGAQAYVLGNEDRITIAFRGTEPKQKSDIIADLKANHNKGCHRGFYQEYKKIRVAIDIELLSQISEKIRLIYVTGHS